jgi:hypothetical protein
MNMAGKKIKKELSSITGEDVWFRGVVTGRSDLVPVKHCYYGGLYEYFAANIRTSSIVFSTAELITSFLDSGGHLGLLISAMCCSTDSNNVLRSFAIASKSILYNNSPKIQIYYF